MASRHGIRIIFGICYCINVVYALTNSTPIDQYEIHCDETIAGNLSYPRTPFVIFNNTKDRNVLFTNCGSPYSLNHGLFLKNSSGTNIQSQSINKCDGTDCPYADVYCNESGAETFVMLDLPEGIYTIVVDMDWPDGWIDTNDSDLIFHLKVVCDPIHCNQYEYNGQDESSSLYQCQLTETIMDMFNDQFCRGEFGLTASDLQEINTIYEMLVDSRVNLGLQNNVIRLSLLFVNVSTAIFIIFGLNQLSLDLDVGTITSVIALTHLVVITSFLSFTYFQFGSCSFGGIENMPTPFHFAILFICIILCTVWTYFVCPSISWRGCCKFFCSILPLVIFMAFLVIYVANDWYTWMPVLFILLHFLFHSLLPALLCKLIPHRKCPCTCGQKACRYVECWAYCGVVSMICSVIAVSFPRSNLDWFGSCFLMGSTSWFNPLFLFTSLYLLFSKHSNFRILTILQNVILLLIVLVDLVKANDSQYFCFAIINVQYFVHSFSIPVYILLLFDSLPTLNRLKISIIGIYFVCIDVFSDFVVVYFFIDETEYLFAVLQIIAIIAGQTIGAVSDVFSKIHEDFTTADKVMALMGFGRTWFTVNWWKETLTTEDDNGKYKVLRKKHKIWDLLYETFPTIGLQIFAAMTTNVSPIALLISIVTSIISICFSITIYLKDLLSVTRATPNINSSATPSLPSSQERADLTVIESLRRSTAQRVSNVMYLHLFAFMFSDFYIRTIPTMMMLAAISIKLADFYSKFLFGSVLFGVLAVFEFIANKKIRISSHRGFVFILTIFATSIFSSFHTMLSTLSVLKWDPFYAESVVFSKYLVEHGIRCAVAMVFCISSVALIGGISWYPWILSADFVVSLLINGRSMRWIYESEFVSTQQHVAQSVELQTVEKEIDGNIAGTAPPTEKKEVADNENGNEGALQLNIESVESEKPETQNVVKVDTGNKSVDVTAPQ